MRDCHSHRRPAGLGGRHRDLLRGGHGQVLPLRAHITPLPAGKVRPPLIKECVANIECRVIDIIERHDIVVLEGLAAYLDTDRQEQRRLHAVGDGTFIVDGRRLDRRKMMATKLPAGV